MVVPTIASTPAPAAAVGRPLKVGVILPVEEGELDGVTARWSDFADIAGVAEEVGFDSLWVPDHLIYQTADGRWHGTWEAWSLLTVLAAVTQRIEIGTFVACAGFRNPALLAKMADTVEEISGGRLILGLGAGWNEPEYRAFGYPFDHRVDRFAEALQIIGPLLREGYVDFVGTNYQARDCELRPRGPRPQGTPLLVGTTRPRMLQLTARYADLWNATFTSSERGTQNRVDRIPALREAVDAACAAEGRDPATLGRTAGVFVQSLPEVSLIWTGTPPLRGTPEELAAALRAYAAEGITHVQLWIEPATPAGIAAFAPVLQHLDQG
jgi:alkanesulfonate monooxygenase SsuD/methylene tetrahydromethanopterin reductase-like flavin-dependent oxidoreductase (luciferase family)